MTILSAIFKKPAKPRKGLRSVSVTNFQGVTRVKRDEFVKQERFKSQYDLLKKLAAEAVSVKE